ncbi:hypothetical protein HDU76_011660 [Blyttiomyces sp. JEL0837]|nr:hypothetical protein HDU76_011660 [Blyttiomyces sp. JEL0837]
MVAAPILWRKLCLGNMFSMDAAILGVLLSGRGSRVPTSPLSGPRVVQSSMEDMNTPPATPIISNCPHNKEILPSATLSTSSTSSSSMDDASATVPCCSTNTPTTIQRQPSHLISSVIAYKSLVREIEIRFDVRGQVRVAQDKGLIALGAWSFWIHDVIKAVSCNLKSISVKIEWPKFRGEDSGSEEWMEEDELEEIERRKGAWCGRGLLNGFLVDCLRWAPYVTGVKHFAFDCHLVDIATVGHDLLDPLRSLGHNMKLQTLELMFPRRNYQTLSSAMVLNSAKRLISFQSSFETLTKIVLKNISHFGPSAVPQSSPIVQPYNDNDENFARDPLANMLICASNLTHLELENCIGLVTVAAIDTIGGPTPNNPTSSPRGNLKTLILRDCALGAFVGRPTQPSTFALGNPIVSTGSTSGNASLTNTTSTLTHSEDRSPMTTSICALFQRTGKTLETVELSDDIPTAFFDLESNNISHMDWDRVVQTLLYETGPKLKSLRLANLHNLRLGGGREENPSVQMCIPGLESIVVGPGLPVLHERFLDAIRVGASAKRLIENGDGAGGACVVECTGLLSVVVHTDPVIRPRPDMNFGDGVGVGMGGGMIAGHGFGGNVGPVIGTGMVNAMMMGDGSSNLLNGSTASSSRRSSIDMDHMMHGNDREDDSIAIGSSSSGVTRVVRFDQSRDNIDDNMVHIHQFHQHHHHHHHHYHQQVQVQAHQQQQQQHQAPLTPITTSTTTTPTLQLPTAQPVAPPLPTPPPATRNLQTQIPTLDQTPQPQLPQIPLPPTSQSPSNSLTQSLCRLLSASPKCVTATIGLEANNALIESLTSLSKAYKNLQKVSLTRCDDLTNTTNLTALIESLCDAAAFTNKNSALSISPPSTNVTDGDPVLALPMTTVPLLSSSARLRMTQLSDYMGRVFEDWCDEAGVGFCMSWEEILEMPWTEPRPLIDLCGWEMERLMKVCRERSLGVGAVGTVGSMSGSGNFTT